MKKQLKQKIVHEIEKNVVCNKYHTGNRHIAYDQWHFKCIGCGQFFTPELAMERLANPMTYDGGGGLASIKGERK